MVQTWGAMGSSRPAWRMSALKMAREMGERACTGTKKLALEGCQVVRSFERPPPGTMVVDVGGVLELPAPGMEDACETREVGADATVRLWPAA